ncbi:MAG: ATP synthase F1 subunit gamma [Clostridiales bacterium]|nr:ATP synthase F1 subunit gamma [Clostridiales bacterium]
MSSIAEIRHHISAVRGTGKITRAMYLISSARMKKAMRMYEQNLHFFGPLRADLRFLLDNMEDEVRNPYFRRHGRCAAYIVIAGDKGMCGGYNNDVLRLASRVIAEGGRVCGRLYTIGQEAEAYFVKRGMHPDESFLNVISNPDLRGARRITQQMCDLFRAKELDEVYLIYTQLEKIGQTRPVALRLLPVLRKDFGDAYQLHEAIGPLSFHPSADEVLDTLVPHYLVGLTYSALVQSYASEHSARMTAMDAATRNANDMLDRLGLELNHARQAAITQEIAEILSGNPNA